MIDPTGYVEMQLREAVKEAGGTIKWNQKTGVATATIGGKTKKYNIRNCKVKNNHIMIDSSKVAKDFGLNVYAVEGRWTLAQTGAYLKFGQAKTAYKQTVKAVALNTGLGAISPILGAGQVVYGTYDSLSHHDYPSLARDASPSNINTVIDISHSMLKFIKYWE